MRQQLYILLILVLAVGGAHGASGLLFNWGFDRFGPPYYVLTNGQPSQPQPELVDFGSSEPAPAYGFKSVCSGEGFTVALSAHGDVYTWGFCNGYGCLANGHDMSVSNPILAWSPADGCQQIACGRHHAVAIVGHGEAYTWGLNNRGQLGTQTPASYWATPSRIVWSPYQSKPSDGLVKDVFAYGDNTAAIGSDDGIYVWGDNAFRQIMHDDPFFNEPILIMIGLSNPVFPTAIGGGIGFSSVLGQDNNVYMWGLNTHGQLGTGHYANLTEPKAVPALPAIMLIAGGPDFMLATDSIVVYSWGNNDFGQLGHSIGEMTVPTPGTVVWGDFSPAVVTSLCATTLTGTVLDGQGIVFAWGVNTYFTLGTPVAAGNVSFAIPYGALAVSCGAYHMAAIASPASPSVTPTPSSTSSSTPTPSSSTTPTVSPSSTATPTRSPHSHTPSSSESRTATPSVSMSPTRSFSPSTSVSGSTSRSSSVSWSNSLSSTPSRTASASLTASASTTPTPTSLTSGPRTGTAPDQAPQRGSVGATVGIAVGASVAVVALFAAAIGIFMWNRRRKRRDTTSDFDVLGKRTTGGDEMFDFPRVQAPSINGPSSGRPVQIRGQHGHAPTKLRPRGRELPKTLFISYGRSDRITAAARQLKDDLIACGYTVWMDEEGVHAGANFMDAIGLAIQRCEGLIALIDTKYCASDFCKNELHLAHAERKSLFPCMMEAVELPPAMKYLLVVVNYIRFDIQPFESARSALIAGMERERISRLWNHDTHRTYPHHRRFAIVVVLSLTRRQTNLARFPPRVVEQILAEVANDE